MLSRFARKQKTNFALSKLSNLCAQRGRVEWVEVDAEKK